jgi:hypothetical protein
MSWLEEELTKKQAKKQKITGSDVAQCLEEEFPLASGRLPYWLPIACVSNTLATPSPRPAGVWPSALLAARNCKNTVTEYGYK